MMYSNIISRYGLILLCYFTENGAAHAGQCTCIPAYTFKARLHLQFLLRFQTRFSSPDGCERMDEFRNV